MIVYKPWGYFRTTLFKACIESMGVGGNYCPYITGERKYWADHERLFEVCYLSFHCVERLVKLGPYPQRICVT